MDKKMKKKLQNPCPKCLGRGVYQKSVPHYYMDRDKDGNPVKATKWIKLEGPGSKVICSCVQKKKLKPIPVHGRK